MRCFAGPQIRQLRRHDQYLLNDQGRPGEHRVFAGEVAPSLSGKGVSVTFKREETLTADPLSMPYVFAWGGDVKRVFVLRRVLTFVFGVLLFLIQGHAARCYGRNDAAPYTPPTYVVRGRGMVV